MNFGNWIDLVVIAVLGYFVVRGMERGIFIVLAEMMGWWLGWVMGRMAAKYLSFLLINYFNLPVLVAQQLVLVLVMGLVAEGVYKLLSSWSLKLPRNYFPGWWQGLLGIPPSLLQGLAVMILVVTILAEWSFAGSVQQDVLQSFFYTRVVSRLNLWI